MKEHFCSAKRALFENCPSIITWVFENDIKLYSVLYKPVQTSLKHKKGKLGSIFSWGEIEVILQNISNMYGVVRGQKLGFCYFIVSFKFAFIVNFEFVKENVICN